MDDIKFYGSATVGSKGQIVIPYEAREELSIREGEKMIIMKTPNGEGLVVLKPKMLTEMVAKLQMQIGHIDTIMTKEKE